MDPLDEQVEAVAAMLRAAGGVVGIDSRSPDFVKRAFLEMVMGCPDCRQAIRGSHDGAVN